jgi:FkbM family methyltransferase
MGGGIASPGVQIVDRAQRAVQKYGWKETARRGSVYASRRLRLQDRYRSVRSRLTDGQARRIVRAGGLDPAKVLIISDPRFGKQIARKGTTDWPTFHQVFNREDYKFKHSVAPRTIVDLGANVGYSAVWYHARYPDARIVAVEPDAANASAARVNIDLGCRGGGRVDLVESAIWHRNATLKITNPNGNAWAFRVRETDPDEPGSFRATTMGELMQRFGLERVDLVKIDIEAGERFLFADNTEWLDAVNSLVIELHDRHTPGCREPVIKALDRHFVDYDEVVRGENTLFTRRHRLEELAGAAS